jgi:hypothetical protein
MTIRYVDNPAAGTQSGDSWTNAAPVSSLLTLYANSVPGDEIWLTSMVSYSFNGGSDWTNANGLNASGRVRIRGMRKNGTTNGFPDKAVIYGNRTTPWPLTGIGSDGSTFFRASTGAQYTSFENLTLMSYDSCFQFRDATGNNSGLHIIDVNMINCKSGIGHGVADTDPVGTRIRRFNAYGFSSRHISIGWGSSDTVIEDCVSYCLNQDDNDVAVAPCSYFLDGAASNVRIRRCTSFGGIDIRSTANYWQGQGFNSEENTNDVIWEDCYAADWPDAGWDSKSSNAQWIRCVAERNMRNYRFHRGLTVLGTTATLVDCISRYPRYYGGTGSAAHVQIAAGQPTDSIRVSWLRGRFEDHEATTPIISPSDTYHVTTITDALIRKHPSAVLVSNGTPVTFTNCVTETEA